MFWGEGGGWKSGGGWARRVRGGKGFRILGRRGGFGIGRLFECLFLSCQFMCLVLLVLHLLN